MNQVLLFMLRLGALFFIASTTAFSLHTPTPLGLMFLYLVAGLFLVAGLAAGLNATGLLGFAVMLAPTLGRGAVHFCAASFLLGHTIGSLFDDNRQREEENASKEILSLALVCCLAAFIFPAIIPFTLDIDPQILGDIFRSGGLGGFYAFWSTTPLTAARAMTTLNGYLLIFCFVSSVAETHDIAGALSRFFRGTVWGLVCSAGFVLAQMKDGPPVFQTTFSEYWRMLRQYPGASTDPNALGISCALLLPTLLLLYRERKIFRAFVGLLLLFLGLYSGSRTFFLSLLLCGVIFLYRVIRRFKSTPLNAAFGVGVGGMMLSLVLLGHPGVNDSLQKALPMTGSVRVLKSLNWNERGSMFASRVIFSRVAVRAWKESPIIGLGLERFYERQQAAMESLGIDLGGWLDNANNFYLQLLSECGLFGLSLFLLALSLIGIIVSSPHLQDDPEDPGGKHIELAGSRTLQSIGFQRVYPPERMQAGARAGLLVFAIILLTGPHLLNPEVQMIFSATLAAACLRPVLVRKTILGQLRIGTLGALFAFSFGFIVLAGMQFSPKKSRGFYPPESTTAPLVRWSGSHAKIVLCQNTADTVQFRFRSLKPGLEKNPVRVKLHEGEVDHLGDTTQYFELTNNEWTPVIVPLRPDAAGQFPRAVVSFTVSPLWSPLAGKTGDDPRWLGVLVELPEKSC